MGFSREKNGTMNFLLAVVFVGIVAMPGVAFGQGTNEPPYVPGDEPSENPGDGSTTEPIDTANGNCYLSESRNFIPCPGVPLVLDLKYDSIASNPEDGALGKGWCHSLEWYLDVQNDQAVLYTGSGEKKVFEEDAGGGYLSPKSNNWTLEETISGYEVGMPGGMAYIFDSAGQLDLIQDAWGNWVECLRGTNNCLETATHSNGRRIVFSNEWHASIGEWRVASIAVQDGMSLAFEFDDGQFTQIVEQVGSTTYTSRYQYADSYLTNKVNGAGFEYPFGYIADEYGELTGKAISLDVDGYYEHTVAYEPGIADVAYSRRGGEQVFRYLRNGGALTAKYGPAESVQDVEDRGTSYGYATAEGIDKTEETLFDDTVNETFSEWMLYDDRHNMTNYAVSYCTTNPVQRFSMEYDPVWQLPSAFMNAEGHRIGIVYTNGLPLIVKAFHSASNSYDTCFTFTTNGLPLAITNANSHVVRFGHDGMGNLAAVVPEAGPIVTNTHTALGFVQSTEILSESGASTGRITLYDTNAKGWLLQEIFPDGSTNSYMHNALGYTTGTVDRAGRKTEFTFAPTRKLTSATRYLNEGGSNTPVRIGYDLDKQVNLLRISEPRGRYVESYLLDIQDRAVAVTNIEGQVMDIDRGIVDFVRRVVRFDGTSVTNTHDNAGRRETATYLSATGVPLSTITQTYYPDNEPWTISDGFSSITTAFNRLNWLTGTTSSVPSAPFAFSAANHRHDAVGNATNTVVSVGPHSIATDRSFDAAERLAGIFATQGTNETQGFIHSYSPENGLVESVSNTVSGITARYGRDIMDQTTNITYRAGDGTLICSIDLGYDAVSMVTDKNISLGTRSIAAAYVNDSLDRLVHESVSTNGHPMAENHYSYDLAGNRLAKTKNGIRTSYALGIGNRLSSASVSAVSNTLFVTGTANEPIGTDPRWGELWVTNFTSGASVVPSVNGSSFFAEIAALSGQTNSVKAAIRDWAGNMGYATKDYWVGSATESTNQTQNFAYNDAGCMTNLNGLALDWDERYRLVSAHSATSAVSYTYDVLNRRFSRIEGSTTNYFVYDSRQVAADLDGNGDLLRTYVWGIGIDNLLCFTDHTTSNTYYAIKDHQNTVIALTDDSGAVVELYEYDAYGSTKVFDASGTELNQSAYGNRYAFQGREIDWGTGLYYFRARWYDPETGRWLSKDPIGITGGLNQYVFCSNNPVNFIDPLGLCEDYDQASMIPPSVYNWLTDFFNSGKAQQVYDWFGIGQEAWNQYGDDIIQGAQDAWDAAQDAWDSVGDSVADWISSDMDDNGYDPGDPQSEYDYWADGFSGF